MRCYPDIIALQEHYIETDDDLIDLYVLIQSWFQEDVWYRSELYRDNIILSRFPILQDSELISSNRTMCALLDTEDEIGENLLIINSHLSCCENNQERQEEADEFISVWRDWIFYGDGPFNLEYETPFVHVGDFNFVGYSQQVKTILYGDIVNEEIYGSDFLPDWDNTGIIDLFSRHTHKRMGYTWRRDYEGFSPGKLDYIFYSDATIEVGSHYVLNTLAMDEVTLFNYDLELYDTHVASDHMPRVFDIYLVNNNLGDVNSDGLINVSDIVSLVSIIMDNGEYILSGDINGDGYLNILDVIQLVTIILAS